MEKVKLSKKEYSEYLKTEHWRCLRGVILIKYPKCFKCKRPAEQVHHLIYREDVVTTQENDLISLCGSCHCLVHRGIDLGLIPSPARGWRKGKLETFTNNEFYIKKKVKKLTIGRVEWEEKRLKEKRLLFKSELDNILSLERSDTFLFRRILGFLKISNSELQTSEFTNLKLDKMNWFINKFNNHEFVKEYRDRVLSDDRFKGHRRAIRDRYKSYSTGFKL